MSRRTLSRVLQAAALVLAVTTGVARAQGPHGPHGQGMPPGGGRGMGPGMTHDAGHQADMEVFHQLLDNGNKVTRTVTPRPDGVESVTESDDPVIAKAIQTHLDAMSARVKEQRPIHQRDPLFREVFANADRIVLRHEMTPKGVRAVETSTDPYVVKLIQAHAEVVTAFIANGRAEAMKDHPVPSR
ncbi:hypothetical protein TBR22_A10440 [Luteitalea sp. TBR-22]|uniref:hypothetical protein n=1 Tax=Luteitalea sp. TBR-22 TaxID=2802971 RepID=UPI001AF37969|nr:hypothetical protein [Luteitalea sp. TBR-22]BCS31841.1 hypothetical protein TBR22_A10440 [Luteitalea sp. TBR-22]